MKAAILTFHDTTNYGAALQAYALNQSVRDLGIECETLQYCCKNIVKRELPPRLCQISGYKKKAYWLLSIHGRKKKLRHIRSFIEKNIVLSPSQYDKETIHSANPLYDKFIVGSDIVWETNVTGHDSSFFLDFADPQKRFSYAASFGYDEIPQEDKESCKQLLNDFQAIAVRENQGVKILNELLPDKPVRLVCDPTLLLRKQDWEKHANAKMKVKENEYIFLYFLDNEGKLLQKAREIAKKENKKIVIYTDALKPIPGTIKVSNISPEQFLTLLRRSYLNLTASYHGVCFSILFEKNFAIINRAHSSRILSLLSTLGLSERNLSTNENCCDLPIDYTAVSEKLEQFRGNSIAYLRSILEGDQTC